MDMTSLHFRIFQIAQLSHPSQKSCHPTTNKDHVATSKAFATLQPLFIANHAPEHPSSKKLGAPHKHQQADYGPREVYGRIMSDNGRNSEEERLVLALLEHIWAFL